MTITAPETLDTALRAAQSDPEATPAQQAMAVALAFAVAAESGAQARMLAWWAGRISRVDACFSAATVILQAIAKALLAGEHFAEVEWQHRVSPKIISGREHERLTRAFYTISREAEQSRADALAESLRSLQPGKVSEVSPDQLLMRAERLARSEVIAAGRQGYAEAVSQALADEPGFVWRFATDADPCPKCIALAAQTFPTAEAAPQHGGHHGCVCVLQAEMRQP